MARELVAYGFNGMNNLKKSPGYFIDDTKKATPQIVLNADVLDDGAVILRKGYRKLFSLPGAHSLWSELATLCVANGAAGSSLFKVEAVSAREMCPISGPTRSRMDYVGIDNRVYASNGFWKGIYNLTEDRVHGWGLPLPLAPNITQAEGDLPPGIYKVCYTHFEAPNRIGGNGPEAEISWEGGMAGIQLTNLPGNVLVWITQPNGSEFFLAPVEAGGYIRTPYYAQPLPTFAVEPPPPMSALVFAHGRIWGASGKKVFYSDEFMYENFRGGSYFPFLEDITLIAPINEGLLVSSLSNTWLMKGTTPGKMSLEELGGGAIPGTLTWTMMEGGAYEPKQSRTLCPAWASLQGILIGKHNGHIVHITESRLKINAMSRGAGFHRVQGGVPQTVISLYGSTRGEFDEDLHEIFERGRIYIPAPLEHRVYGGIIIGGEGEYL